MASHLEESGVVALTLSAWYDYDARCAKCGFVDPVTFGELESQINPSARCEGLAKGNWWGLRLELRQLPKGAEDAAYGYGFSYLHLRRPALERPYRDASLGEDSAFLRGLRKACGPESVRFVRDELGVCLHVMHGDNTADSAVHRAVYPDEVMGLAIWSLDFALPMLEAWRSSFVPSDVAGQFRH
mmetsp:Transcript_6362/g.15096  ORF Transcript_6362/g.15096 Transcript_6362/m.15096 type:complete len:185 (-) Transcript_6362:206-760(-)